MARESVTIQCYPDDSIINDKVRLYESFGWELINNQRFQEYKGQMSSGDTVTNHYSTYNKLTFSRSKDEPWYDEVTQLERKYKALDEKEDTILDYKPRRKDNNGYVTFFLVAAILAVVINVILAIALHTPAQFAVAGVIAVIPFLIILTRCLRKKKYNAALEQWPKVTTKNCKN